MNIHGFREALLTSVRSNNCKGVEIAKYKFGVQKKQPFMLNIYFDS